MRKSIGIISCVAALYYFHPLPARADIAQGKKLYGERCVTCHGAEGAGDGPISLSLPPEMKPRNLKDGTMKFAVDAAKFKELLTKGGSGVGLNPLMPPQPDLKDPDISSLYEFVQSLHKK